MSVVWLVEEFCVTVGKSLKEAEADLTWVRSTIATRYATCLFLYIATCAGNMY